PSGSDRPGPPPGSTGTSSRVDGNFDPGRPELWPGSAGEGDAEVGGGVGAGGEEGGVTGHRVGGVGGDPLDTDVAGLGLGGEAAALLADARLVGAVVEDHQ